MVLPVTSSSQYQVCTDFQSSHLQMLDSIPFYARPEQYIEFHIPDLLDFWMKTWDNDF